MAICPKCKLVIGGDCTNGASDNHVLLTFLVQYCINGVLYKSGQVATLPSKIASTIPITHHTRISITA